jgi:hypothetical protein
MHGWTAGCPGERLIRRKYQADQKRKQALSTDSLIDRAEWVLPDCRVWSVSGRFRRLALERYPTVRGRCPKVPERCPPGQELDHPQGRKDQEHRKDQVHQTDQVRQRGQERRRDQERRARRESAPEQPLGRMNPRQEH